MKTIFLDPQAQSQFEENGFVKLSLLNQDEIAQIKTYYQILKANLDIKNSVYGIYVSLDDKDHAMKTAVMNYIQSIILPKLNEKLCNFKVHLGGFIVKQSDDHSYTFPHQDWIFVPHDDKEAFSATIWITLDDLSPEMGSLGFIPKSHTFLDGIIGSPSSYFINATQGHESNLFNYLQFPEISKGEAFVFNNKCVHGANPNSTGTDRVIVGIGITPKEIPLTHYFLKPQTHNQILRLNVPEDFFLTYMNDDLIKEYEDGKIPQSCEVVSEFEFENYRYTPAEMSALLDANGCVKGEYSLISRAQNTEVQLSSEAKIDQPIIKKYPIRDFISKLAALSKIYTPYNVYKESKYRITGKY